MKKDYGHMTTLLELQKMKAVILAGGLGSRLSEETSLKPKPMVEIGGKPILWHLMKIYSNHGVNDFIICLGYKGYVIKEYFANYFLHHADVTIHMVTNQIEYHNANAEPWKITLIDTGQDTMTGGRIKRIANYLEDDQPFCLTYGDGLGDVDITSSIAFHRQQGKKATMTVVSPPGRFGATILNENLVTAFQEKPLGDGARINAGFFVCEKSVINEIDSDQTVWEAEPLRRLTENQELSAWRHDGFWQPMDTLREKHMLENLWTSGNAPWKIW
jgi:glucose-1-phosphate cytidylyltransferase|tara:strand:+ start:19712 stop:20530 length:819 start_codon:yes stop_codon:yes gene_type:complete